MDLYVANISKQIHHFHYRLPESNRTLDIKIQSGQQVKIEVDNTATVDYVVAQHAMYGMREVKQINSRDKFVGLAYQVDKVIDVELLSSGFTHNERTMIEDARTRQEETTVSIAAGLKDSAERSGTKLGDMSVEIVEEKRNIADNDAKTTQKVTIRKGN